MMCTDVYTDVVMCTVVMCTDVCTDVVMCTVMDAAVASRCWSGRSPAGCSSAG